MIGEEKGYRHEAVTHAMVTIERLGKETGLWDTVIRTDTEALTKKKLEYNAKNLDDFDAVVFYTGGTLEMDASQQADFLSFVHDDGKGFIGIHSATITFTKWPAYGEMIGGYFDEHPWGTFDAPVIVEDPAFPGMKQWPSAFTINDEIYQIKDFSRTTTRVLMRLDPSKLDLTNPRVHRKDGDFAVTWAKMYGQGRVFYSTLGHVEANWDKPEMQTMIVEAIKWVLKLVDADVTPRAAALDPPELLDGFPDGTELLDERNHAVFRVVELLGFLEHLRGLRLRHDRDAVLVGGHDVARIHAHAGARHRHVDAGHAVVIDRRGRRDAAAEYRELQLADLRRVADRGVDHRPGEAAVLHRRRHQAADAGVVGPSSTTIT